MVSNTLERSAQVSYGTDAMADDPMKKWNVAAPKSIAKAIDAMGKNMGHGEKQNITSTAHAVWLLMGEQHRREWLKQFAMAMTNSRYGNRTVLEEMREAVMGDKMAAWPNPDGSMTYVDRPKPTVEPKPMSPEELKEEAAARVTQVPGTSGKSQPKPSRANPRIA